MSRHLTAEVCLNGHVTTKGIEHHPEFREKFCSKCGEETITRCPCCNDPIRGRHVSNNSVRTVPFNLPYFCKSCGDPFPWTARSIDNATELVGLELNELERKQFHSDLEEMTKDSPKAKVSAVRFRKILEKTTDQVSTGVRDIVIDLVSETAKKIIWGS